MEFTIDGTAYKARQMDAFTQLDVVSILSPLMVAGAAEITPLLQQATEDIKANGMSAALSYHEVVKRLGPLTHELAKMKPEDRRFVLGACLSLVDKQIKEGQWAPVWVPAAGRAADDALNNDLWLMVRIAYAVIRGTKILSFFSVSP